MRFVIVPSITILKSMGLLTNKHPSNEARQPGAGVFCCLDGLRGAILAGGTPLKKPSADLKSFDA